MDHQQSAKPRAVALAMYLMWASLAVILVKFAFNYSNPSAAPDMTLTLVVAALTVVVYVFLIFMISARKNWARIAFLVLFLIGLVPSLPVLLADFGRSPLIGGLSLADVVLQAWALFLVFTSPGKTWFQKRAPG